MPWGPIVALLFLPQSASPPVLTVCEALQDLKAYNGKDVVIVARSGFTFEGTFLGEHCEPDDRTLIQGHRWSSMIAIGRSLPSIDVASDEALIRRKLEDLKRAAPASDRPSGPFAPHWVVLFGRLDSPPKLQPHRPPSSSDQKNIPGKWVRRKWLRSRATASAQRIQV
jgi:hypothetical protein